jgi:flagellar operon protein
VSERIGDRHIEPVINRNPVRPAAPKAAEVSFADLLQRQVAGQRGVKFSAHAAGRLAQANIALDQGQVERLEQAVDKAAAKGARESLILMDNLALVVSIRNRTVITAVDEQRMKQHVFTNIDSAVIT